MCQHPIPVGAGKGAPLMGAGLAADVSVAVTEVAGIRERGGERCGKRFVTAASGRRSFWPGRRRGR